MKNINSKLFNWWTFGGILVFGFILFGIVAIIFYASRPEKELLEETTAVIAVIPAPTFTAVTTPTEEITPQPDAGLPPSPPPGSFMIGSYVQISGTGGDGLRLRADAGLDNPVGFLGWESEVFIVIDGPVDVDGYTWWLLEAPYDEGQRRRGWAVSNYLESIQTP